VVEDLSVLDGDFIVLGVAGKVGICLARMIKRAVPHRRVVGVARFSDPALKTELEAHGIETIRCDLLDREAVEALPKLRNVVYMAGLKFDATGREDFLWAMNTIAPAIVAEAFKASRIVAFCGARLAVDAGDAGVAHAAASAFAPLLHAAADAGEWPAALRLARLVDRRPLWAALAAACLLTLCWIVTLTKEVAKEVKAEPVVIPLDTCGYVFGPADEVKPCLIGLELMR
jgi:hypothetical protein